MKINGNFSIDEMENLSINDFEVYYFNLKKRKEEENA